MRFRRSLNFLKNMDSRSMSLLMLILVVTVVGIFPFLQNACTKGKGLVAEEEPGEEDSGSECDKSTEECDSEVSFEVTQLEPSSLRVGVSGEKLAITGTGFGREKSDVSVLIDDISCDVTSVSSRKIKCEIPEGTESGLVDVEVIVDEESSVIYEAFTYIGSDELVISSMSPSVGATSSSGVIMTIEGYFDKETKFELGGNNVTCDSSSFKEDNGTSSVSCIVPAYNKTVHSEDGEKVDLVATSENDEGQSITTTNSGVFTYYNSPSITTVSYSSTSSTDGTLTLFGEDFIADLAEKTTVKLKVDDVTDELTKFERTGGVCEVSDTEISCPGVEYVSGAEYEVSVSISSIDETSSIESAFPSQTSDPELTLSGLLDLNVDTCGAFTVSGTNQSSMLDSTKTITVSATVVEGSIGTLFAGANCSGTGSSSSIDLTPKNGVTGMVQFSYINSKAATVEFQAVDSAGYFQSSSKFSVTTNLVSSYTLSISGPSEINTYACAVYNLTVENSDTSDSTTQAITLGTDGGTLYENAECSTTLSGEIEVSLSSGSTEFYFKSEESGSPTITASIPDSTVSDKKGPSVDTGKLSWEETSFTFVAGECNSIDLTADLHGTGTSYYIGDVEVALSSGLGSFYDTEENCGNTADSIKSIKLNSLSSGEETKTVYYKSDTAGTGTITATAAGYFSMASASVVIDETVIPPPTTPTVTISIPTADDEYTATSNSITLSGTASDATSVTWSNTLTGDSGTESDTTSWSVSNISLSSGSNTIIVTATDDAGNTATDTITVTYTAPTTPTPDTTKPSVTISDPTTDEEYSTTSNSISLSGSVSDDNGIDTVTWSNSANSTSGTALGLTSGALSGNWSASMFLDEGDNTITVTATDGAGNTASDTITVTYNALTEWTVSPTTMESGKCYSVTVNASSAVSGQSLVEVTDNGGGGSFNTGSGCGSAVPSVYIQTGTSRDFFYKPNNTGSSNKSVTLTANWANDTDTKITKTITVTPSSSTTPTDTTAPTGSIDINGTNTATTSIKMTLKASDSAGVTGYYLSTSSATPSASASDWTSVTSTTSYSASPVSYTLATGDGLKTVYVWYKDSAGNVSAIASDSITLDQTAPTVTITSPTSSTAYSATSATISLSGTASDTTSGISIVAWGMKDSSTKSYTGIASGTTNWTVSNITLSSGDNVITVTATNGAGNTATDTITVTYTVADTTAPTGSITIQEDGTGYVTSTSFYVTLTATDNVGVTGYYVSTSSASPSTWNSVTSTTSYSYVVKYTMPSSAASGDSHTVYVWYKDSAGNISARASDIIYLDTTPPKITTLDPASGVSQPATQNLTINGSGFPSTGFTIKVGNDDITKYCSYVSSSKYTCTDTLTYTTSCTTGVVQVTVTSTDDGVSIVSNDFDYTFDNTPTITKINGSSDGTGEKTELTSGSTYYFHGTNFAPNSGSSADNRVSVHFYINSSSTTVTATCTDVSNKGDWVKCTVPTTISGGTKVYAKNHFKTCTSVKQTATKLEVTINK